MDAADARPLTPAQQQFGNQNAKGCTTSGRPRTVCPPKEELELLGVEMVEWFKNNPDALHISEWYCLEKFFLDSVWENMIIKPEFSGYYEKAKRMVGKKYLDKTSNVREGVSQRWQHVYFKDLKKEEREQAAFEAELKAAALKSEAAAIEQEKHRVMEEVARSRRDIL